MEDYDAPLKRELISMGTIVAAAIASIIFLFTTFALKGEVADVKNADAQAHLDFKDRLRRIEDKLDRAIAR